MESEAEEHSADQLLTADIFGCCVSRDIFGIAGDRDVKICKYIEGISPVSAFCTEKPDFQITADDSSEERMFRKRCVCHDFNKDVIQTLFFSGAEWVIVDTRPFVYNLVRVSFGEKTIDFTETCFNTITREELKGYPHRSLEPKEVDFGPFLYGYVNFLRDRYGDKIILIQIRESDLIRREDGSIDTFGNAEINAYVTELEHSFDKVILDHLKCYYIKCPEKIIADQLHKWGVDSVHYIPEYYEYARDAVSVVMDGEPDKEKRLEELYTQFNSKIEEMSAAPNPVSDSVQNQGPDDIQ